MDGYLWDVSMFVTPCAHKCLCRCVTANTPPVMPHIGAAARLVPCLRPGPAPAEHRFTNCMPAKPRQSPPDPKQQLPTHSIHSSTLLTGSGCPRRPPLPASSSHFNTVPRDRADRVFRGVMLRCWMVARHMTGRVLACFILAPAACEGMYRWWGASEVLWRWDNCCKASPCSHALPGSLGWAAGEATAGPFGYAGGPCLWFWWALGKP